MKNKIILIFCLSVTWMFSQQKPNEFEFINKYKYVYVETIVSNPKALTEEARNRKKVAAKLKEKIEVVLRQSNIPVLKSSAEIPVDALPEDILKLSITSVSDKGGSQVVKFSNEDKILLEKKYSFRILFTISVRNSKTYFKPWQKNNKDFKAYKYVYYKS